MDSGRERVLAYIRTNGRTRPVNLARHLNLSRMAVHKILKKLTEKEERLKISAVMLYWAEGYKVGRGTVDFANSDPDMVVIFWKFLSEICQVNRNRVRLHLYAYEGQDIQNLMQFWCTLLNLPKHHFIKPYIKKAATPGPRGPRMVHGLVHIRYSDTKLLRQILEWIDGYRQNLTK